MESILFSLSWICHRSCPHCPDERMGTYSPAEAARLVTRAKNALPRIVDHFPESMMVEDVEDEAARPGRIVLTGGEVLTDPVREALLYPALQRLATRYRDAGSVNLVVRTTGELLDAEVLDDLVEKGATLIQVTGTRGLLAQGDPDAAARLADRLADLFARAGLTEAEPGAVTLPGQGLHYTFSDLWPDPCSGRVPPAGRAWKNSLCAADMEDDFCNTPSGGLGFLRFGQAGSEVVVDCDGSVFPCRRKTRFAIGNLRERPLADICRGLAGHPVFEAISAGRPQRMGTSFGWDEQAFLENCFAFAPNGRSIRNLCLGCDWFFDEFVAGEARDHQTRRGTRRYLDGIR